MSGGSEAQSASEARPGLSKITFQVGELRALAESATLRDTDVSAWTVGMHVHHCALAMSGIAQELLACDSRPPSEPTAIGWLVLKTGKIPRGGARAPDGTLPEPGAKPNVLDGMLTLGETLLEQVPEATEQAWFQHFALGVLTRDRALRFIEIHNDHHLAIIEDILRRSGGS